ncbi:PKDCC [Mytilus edulis]|uniref:PKDCC n=1 Tax=Mytilus edulis TaxID=6550 RepID=A0A8S3SFP0_MYTED|nr:PKDCC [Mytilus edulis]
MQTQSRDRNVITESHKQKYLNSTESYSRLRNTFNDKYIFNCANIHKIHIFKNDVGQGRSKSVDIGTYNGQKVVIKKLSSFKNRVRQEYRQLLFMKEILIRDQLEYPGLIKMLGYCVRHLNSEGFQRRHPHRGDITAVYEYGVEFDIRNLTLNIEERLVHALKLADLILYLQNSPLGSLMIGDFKDAHFIMVNNRIKLIDFDYMHNVEHPCLFLPNQPKTDCPFNIDCTKLEANYSPSSTLTKPCYYNKGCKLGECRGYNVKYNIKRVNQSFYRTLLKPELFPSEMQQSLSNLNTKLEGNAIDIEDLIPAVHQEIGSITQRRSVTNQEHGDTSKESLSAMDLIVDANTRYSFWSARSWSKDIGKDWSARSWSSVLVQDIDKDWSARSRNSVLVQDIGKDWSARSRNSVLVQDIGKDWSARSRNSVLVQDIGKDWSARSRNKGYRVVGSFRI